MDSAASPGLIISTFLGCIDCRSQRPRLQSALHSRQEPPMVDPRTLTPKLPPLKLYIANQFVDAQAGGTLPVTNPATGEKVCDCPAATAADVERAVKAARTAFETGPWRTMNASQRGKLLRAFADLVWNRREELALLESMENGKTFKDA